MQNFLQATLMQVIARPILVSSYVITLLAKVRALHTAVFPGTMQQCYLSTIRKECHRMGCQGWKAIAFDHT